MSDPQIETEAAGAEETTLDAGPDLIARLSADAATRVRAGEPAQAVFDAVVAAARDELPSDVWDAVAATDVAADVPAVAAWIAHQLDNRPPPAELSGLRFSLYQVRGIGPGRMEAAMGMSGGPGYPEPSWLTDRNWDPAGYAPTEGLKQLLPAASPGSDEVRAVVARAVALAYGLGVAADVVEAVGPERLLDGREALGLAAGFSDGDLVVLGVLTAAGLDRTAG